MKGHSRKIMKTLTLTHTTNPGALPSFPISKKRTAMAIQVFLLNQRFEHTRTAYGKDLRDFFMAIGETDLKTIGKVHLIAFRHALEQHYETTSVARKLACIRSFFKFCEAEGYIEKNPATGLKCPGAPLEGKTVEFTDDEVRLMLEAPDLTTVKGVRDRTLLEFLFYLGLRVSELTSIKIGDFLKDGKTAILKIKGKGGKERAVPLQPHLIEWVERYLRLSPLDLAKPKSTLFRPIKNPHNGDLEKAITPRSVWVIVKNYAKKAGIHKRVTPHSGRVTATGNALDHQAGLIEITEMMGWSSIKMCQKYDRRRKQLIHSAAFKISYDKS